MPARASMTGYFIKSEKIDYNHNERIMQSELGQRFTFFAIYAGMWEAVQNTF